MKTAVLSFVSYVVVAGVLTGCSGGAEVRGMLFYVPLGFSTYKPVTPESIDAHHYEHVAADARQMRRIEQVLRKAVRSSRPFREDITRVKVVVDGRTKWLIDNDGGVRSEAGELTLPKNALVELKEVIESGTVRKYEAGRWPREP